LATKPSPTIYLAGICMKIIKFDQGFKLDDPNSYWGDPSYQLEPGDPGYIPPIPLTKQTPKRRKRMKRDSWYPLRAAAQVICLANLGTKLPGYSALLGLSAPELAALLADINWVIYLIKDWLPSVRAFAPACTDATKEAQLGDGLVLMVLPVYTPPALPMGTAPTNTGALNRIFTAVATLKKHPACTETVATDLGIIGSEMTGPDYATLAPPFKLNLIPTGVEVLWTWGGFGEFLDMCEIQVDRDGTGYKFLATDTTPGYLDTFPRPAVLTKWKYRLIYRVGDDQVGQWSAEKSVAVGG